MLESWTMSFPGCQDIVLKWPMILMLGKIEENYCDSGNQSHSHSEQPRNSDSRFDRSNPLVPFPHRLLFLTGDNFGLLNFRFPSKFIEELIVMVHELSEKTTALRYLSAREVAQIYWRIFEHGCILTLTTESLEPLPMKQLVPPADSASSKPERWETT